MTTLRIFLSIDMLIERVRGFFFSADRADIRTDEVCTGCGGLVAGLILYFFLPDRRYM